MKRYVLDTHAVIAYLEGEEAGKNVIPILESALDDKAEILMSVINWGEVYYIALREGGKERAEIYREIIAKYPIEIVDADKELTLLAAKFKAHYKISYADAFAAAVTEMKKAHLVTGDPEFKALESKFRIVWI